MFGLNVARKWVDLRNAYQKANGLGTSPYQLWPAGQDGPIDVGNGPPPANIDQMQKDWKAKSEALEAQWLKSLPPEDAATAVKAFTEQSENFQRHHNIGKGITLGLLGTMVGGAIAPLIAPAAQAVTGATGSSLAGTATQGAVQGAVNSGIQGAVTGNFDLGNIATGALTGGLGAGVNSLVPAANTGSGLLDTTIKGATTGAINSTIGGAVRGDLDAGNIATGAIRGGVTAGGNNLINSGINTVINSGTNTDTGNNPVNNSGANAMQADPFANIFDDVTYGGDYGTGVDPNLFNGVTYGGNDGAGGGSGTGVDIFGNPTVFGGAGDPNTGDNTIDIGPTDLGPGGGGGGGGGGTPPGNTDWMSTIWKAIQTGGSALTTILGKLTPTQWASIFTGAGGLYQALKAASGVPVPDFDKFAREQATLANEAANKNTVANRPDQVDAQGNTLTWTQNPDGTWKQEVKYSAGNQDILDRRTGLLNTSLDQIQNRGAFNPTGLTNVLDPTNPNAPKVLDPTNPNAPSVLNPEADEANLMDLMDPTGNSSDIQNAWMNLLRPEREQARATEIQRLKAQGIPENSAAWTRALARLDTGDTDAQNKALIAGTQEYGNRFNRSLAGRTSGLNQHNAAFGNSLNAYNSSNNAYNAAFGNSLNAYNSSNNAYNQAFANSLGANQQGFNQYQTGYNAPMNTYTGLINAGNPQTSFANVPNATPYVAPNVYGAAQDTFTGNVANVNAQNAHNSNLAGGLLRTSSNLGGWGT